MPEGGFPDGEGEAADPQHIVGAVLIQAIQKRAIELNLTSAETSDQLKISYTYFSALTTGRRPISQLKREAFRRIADFLRVPLVQVLVWAEVVKVEDFVYEETLEEDIEISYQKMARDPHWGGVVPVRLDWDQTPTGAKLAIILLYERVAEKRLMEKIKVGAIIDKKDGE